MGIVSNPLQDIFANLLLPMKKLTPIDSFPCAESDETILIPVTPAESGSDVLPF